MNKFEVNDLEIPDVKLITHKCYYDNRGYFSEIYNADALSELGIIDGIVQENYTINHRGVVRGLHCQLSPYAQGKMVRCVKGKIFDVAVDVRQGSPWFGKWLSIELSEDDANVVWIPVGFLHGFCALEDKTVVEFKCTGPWKLEYERGVIWNDSHLNINWPIPHDEIIVSERELVRNDFSAVNNWFRYSPEAVNCSPQQ
jgi:dTDP-4-dehydrorhamnose 3,5-epimerase